MLAGIVDSELSPRGKLTSVLEDSLEQQFRSHLSFDELNQPDGYIFILIKKIHEFKNKF